MPDEPKSNAKNETAADFIQSEIERTKNNLQCAINTLGHSALKAANPVRAFKRHPVKAGIVTAAALAGGTLAVALAFSRRNDAPVTQGPPVNVYVKKTKPKSTGWGQLGTALVAALTAKATQGVRTTITNSFSNEFHVPGRTKVAIAPNPKLRDVQI